MGRASELTTAREPGHGLATAVVTVGGERTSITDEALQEIRATLRGDVFVPGDPGYERVRVPFNAMYPGRPALVVRPRGTADVVDSLRFARRRQFLVAVRGGGHSVAGLSSVDGGMLIDLALMNGVDVDPDARLARVQGGALWAHVDRETQAFGLVAPGGVVSDTGVAGLTLGGGQGWVRRKYGLSCDSLLSAQVVCADGEVRMASAETNPGLYWAIRGGGGNFGIVTQFTFRLHPLPRVVAFVGVFYPLDDAAVVLRRYRDYALGAPDEVSAQAIAFTLPAAEHLPVEVHGQACLIIAALYAGDADKGMSVLQPLRDLGRPLADISGPTPFRAVQSGFDPLFARGTLRAYLKSTYFDRLSDDSIDVIVQRMHDRPTPRTLIAVLLMGGQINRVTPADTAYAQRSAEWMVSVDGFWSDPDDDRGVIGWTRDAWRQIARFGNGSVYLNFTGISDEPGDTSVAAAHGPNLRRLAQIKAAYDPTNFFRLNNNIAPLRQRQEAP